MKYLVRKECKLLNGNEIAGESNWIGWISQQKKYFKVVSKYQFSILFCD